MIRLEEPQWLLMLPVLALLAWRLPRLRLLQPLRSACVLLLVLLLAGPTRQTGSPGTDLWVLVDRSDSAAGQVAASLAEWEKLLEESRGEGDRIHYIDFAASPVQRETGIAFEPATSATALRQAVELALARMDPDRNNRLLALTDGFATEDLEGMEEKLRKAGVPLDLRLFPWDATSDFVAGALKAPLRVAPAQNFLIEAPVTGPAGTNVAYEVLCDGDRVGTGSVHLGNGRGLIRLSGRLEMPGARHYEVRIMPEADPRPGNNSASAWVEVMASGNVLLISAFPDDPLPAVLKAAGFAVEFVTDPATLHAGHLSGRRAVIINNVAAGRLPAKFLESMDFFVRDQGGGLLMTGGRQSFGAGGYFESPVDALLPVSMELRQEHRKLAVAMAIVMDRSGSMSAAAAGGVTKMDLANEGAARAIELLGPSDAITVFAVDSEAHEVIPLSMIGSNSAKLGDTVRRIRSTGGGIFVHRGLNAAWKELQKSVAGQRHLILFSDAADSEEPGDYQALLSEMVTQGTSVSVIALGSPADVDAPLLEDIARLGNGRIFFNADANQLPGLFAQETVSVARSAFLRSPVAVVDTGGWRQIANSPPGWLEKVDGYNLCYLRPEASAAAISGDEYKAPLVAFWQRGAGRAAAVTFPVSGVDSESFRSWQRAPDFLQTLVRWLIPATPPSGTALKTSFQGNDLLVDFFYSEEFSAKFAETPPGLIAAEGTQPGKNLPWEKIESGRFQARIPVPPGSWIRGVVALGKARIPFGPVSAGIDPEWTNNPAAVARLRSASKATGGRDLPAIKGVWEGAPSITTSSLQNLLLPLLIILLLAEIALTRWKGRSGNA